MNVTLGFRKIEAKGYSAVDLQRLTGLDGEALFVQIEQFAQVHHDAGLRGIETGVDRGVEFMTNVAPALSGARPRDWTRQSAKTLLHNRSILTQGWQGRQQYPA
jgi:hypothetical protein